MGAVDKSSGNNHKINCMESSRYLLLACTNLPFELTCHGIITNYYIQIQHQTLEEFQSRENCTPCSQAGDGGTVRATVPHQGIPYC